MNGAGAGNMFCSVVPAAAAEHLHDARAVLLADAGDEPGDKENEEAEDDVQRQVRLGLRRREGEEQASVGHHERPPHVARGRGHPQQQAQREHHRARDPEPARHSEHPVPRPVQVAHDGVPGAVQLAAVPRRCVLRPVPAGDAGAEQEGERRDQRGRHHQRAGVMVLAAAPVRVQRPLPVPLLDHGHGNDLHRRQRRIRNSVGGVPHLKAAQGRQRV
uniref:Uncharacterized protein n=1 Tax=Zea mays TaxID=4577 RepID=A0A804LHB3_MAIZE